MACNAERAVALQLKKEGLGDVRLTVVDNAVITNNYTQPILQDEELMKQVGALTFHTYEEHSAGPQVEGVKASKYPQERVWTASFPSD